jgi:hypothetical protein
LRDIRGRNEFFDAIRLNRGITIAHSMSVGGESQATQKSKNESLS